jgi:hypothetical protein
MSKIRRYTLGAAVLLLIVCVATTATVMGGPGGGDITVTGTQAGQTELSIGAVEGCLRFNIADMTDLGSNNYRIYAGMSRVEPNDDDGVYGLPSIAAIKADPDVIPWTEWSYWFNYQDGYFWEGGCATEPGRVQVSLDTLLTALKNNGVTPIVTLRNVDNFDGPAWAMALNPPNSTDDWNEWWEFVFAWVYYANVINSYDVHDWQVHNEPDNDSQGWDGTLADYITFTQYTADAIQYVYDTYLPGETFRLHAPVSTHCNEWITESLIQNDDVLDVVDWHRYGPPEDEAETIQGWIDQYDSDSVHELVNLSEWGTYRESYDTHSNAMHFGQGLVSHSVQVSKVDISSIFSLYNWSGFDGVILPDGTRTETFYSMRLIIRGLQGGRDAYQMTENYTGLTTAVANGKAADGTLYVVIVNRSPQNKSIHLDVSAHATSGTITVREYSASVKDEEVSPLTLSSGVVDFSLAKGTIWLLAIPTGGTPPPTDTPEPQPTDTPEPQPTDTPGSGGTMHVGDITMSCGSQAVFHWATATVTILDAGDQPVGTATVYGSFSGTSSSSVSDDTAGDGTVTFDADKVKNGGTWTFTVDDVVKSGWTYDSGANVETSDSITCP